MPCRLIGEYYREIEGCTEEKHTLGEVGSHPSRLPTVRRIKDAFTSEEREKEEIGIISRNSYEILLWE